VSEPAGTDAMRDMRASLEDAPVLLLECAGPDLKVVAASRMIRSMIGQQPAGMIGRRLAEIVRVPASRQLIDAVKEVYATGIPARDVDWRMPRESGDGNQEELAFSVSAVPAYHPDGSIRGVVVAGLDNSGQASQGQEGRAGAGRSGDLRQAAQHVLLALRRYLLPAGLPVLPQVRLAARYLAAPDDLRAGGTWCDAVASPDGATALTVGDIAGNGLDAVAAMSRLRMVLHGALLHGGGPLRALARLDAFAAQVPAARGATVWLGLLDPATGDLRYASAGHPMPLICGPAGTVSFLPAGAGGPLGVGRQQPALANAVLPPGAVLLLYAGGLASRPGRAARQGREHLAAVAVAAFADAMSRAAADTADRMCSAVAERLTRHGRHDDLTVLSAHLLAERNQGWSMELEGDPAALRVLRSRLRDWLQELSAAPLDSVDMELAVYEAAANAIIHGRPRRGPATVTVQVQLDDAGRALIQVTDRGQWQLAGSPDPGRQHRGGRGLSVIREVADELNIAPSPTGTTVTIRRRLSRPVTMGLAP
jgi:anti-sigma regulatory factor (Ser/Thr protein kinase)